MNHEKTPTWAGEPRWYLWDGGFFALGASRGLIPQHEHHAIQITIGVAGSGRVAGPDGVWHAVHGVIIRPDVRHSFEFDGGIGLMLFVDPETMEGRWLQSSLTRDITPVPSARIEQIAGPLRTFAEDPLAAMDVGELIRHCVRALCAGAPPARRPDPRITQALAAINASPDLRIPLDEAAASVFLSPSRFAHLFTQHVGLPFRRYILWRKLTRALVHIARGETHTRAAHGAGFADAAHLTRTCNQMFGIPPSVMLRGEFFEVPPPFRE